jgi:hypothetical protein
MAPFRMLPSASHYSVGTPFDMISRLDSPARTYPCPCFAAALAGVGAGLGAVVVRYSFDVGLFHSVLHAGLFRRTSR